MSDDGRWVPLPEGQMPARGQRVRVILEDVVRAERITDFTIGRVLDGVCNIVYPAAEHVVSVEVWEPAENLIPGEWYRDANDDVMKWSRNTQDGRDGWRTGPLGTWYSEEVAKMVRPLSIARWDPVQ